MIGSLKRRSTAEKSSAKTWVSLVSCQRLIPGEAQVTAMESNICPQQRALVIGVAL